MSIEKPREFVGGNTPYEKHKVEAQKLEKEAIVLDEKREQAMRKGDLREAEKLNKERERVMEAKRTILNKIAELKKLSLRKN